EPFGDSHCQGGKFYFWIAPTAKRSSEQHRAAAFLFRCRSSCAGDLHPFPVSDSSPIARQQSDRLRRQEGYTKVVYRRVCDRLQHRTLRYRRVESNCLRFSTPTVWSESSPLSLHPIRG